MAHGYRHVPERRTPAADSDHCPFCGAYFPAIPPGGWPHVCKEPTYGIPVSATPFLPLAPPTVGSPG
jgi:hypothetical protein